MAIKYQSHDRKLREHSKLCATRAMSLLTCIYSTASFGLKLGIEKVRGNINKVLDTDIWEEKIGHRGIKVDFDTDCSDQFWPVVSR